MVVQIWSIIFNYTIIAITITYYSIDFHTSLGNYSNKVETIQMRSVKIRTPRIRS